MEGRTATRAGAPDAGSDQAHQILDRMREATPLGQTFSAGVATWQRDESSDELLARADVALYAAKHAGRNRIAVAELALASGT